MCKHYFFWHIIPLWCTYHTTRIRGRTISNSPGGAHHYFNLWFMTHKVRPRSIVTTENVAAHFLEEIKYRRRIRWPFGSRCTIIIIIKVWRPGPGPDQIRFLFLTGGPVKIKIKVRKFSRIFTCRGLQSCNWNFGRKRAPPQTPGG